MPTEITGFDQLAENLNELERIPRQHALRVMVKAGASILQPRMAELAPVDSGALAAGITTKIATGGGADQVEADVGPGKDQFWGLFQEFGTKTQKAQPFMQPAFDQTKDQIQAAMIDAFWGAVPEHMKGKA